MCGRLGSIGQRRQLGTAAQTLAEHPLKVSPTERLILCPQLAAPDAEWSAPLFFTVYSVGVGLTLGFAHMESVILLKSDDAINGFLDKVTAHADRAAGVPFPTTARRRKAACCMLLILRLPFHVSWPRWHIPACHISVDGGAPGHQDHHDTAVSAVLAAP